MSDCIETSVEKALSHRLSPEAAATGTITASLMGLDFMNVIFTVGCCQ